MGERVRMEEHPRYRALSVEERADLAQHYHLEALLYCPDPWAVRHYWVHSESGEHQAARCNRWECGYCGPRKVALWRALIAEAKPTLFLTLTKAGKTEVEARRALKTFMQALRRGSKGYGPHHQRARAPYPVEYFPILEKHKDFERNGFHWHVLLKGVDYISYEEVIRPLWTSATRGQAKEEELAEEMAQGLEEEMVSRVEQDCEGRRVKKAFLRIGWIQRIRHHRAIGYVTKYLMKEVTKGERGKKQVKRVVQVLARDEQGQLRRDEQGQVILEPEVRMEETTAKPHRICYSRGFFPERVADLRKRLFAGIEQEVMGEADVQEEAQGPEKQRSCWRLMERQAPLDLEAYKQERRTVLAQEVEACCGEDEVAYQTGLREAEVVIEQEVQQLWRQVYRQWRRRCLVEALEDLDEGAKYLSLRVISAWHHRRRQMRLAG